MNIVRRLLDMMGANKKCENKYVPDSIKFGSRKVRLEVLAGLMDTDGSYDKRGGCFDFISKSERLADDVAFLARSLGMAAYIAPATKGAQTGSKDLYWRVSLSGHVNMIPCRLPRKQAVARQQIKDVLNTGFEIVELVHGPWVGIVIDGDGQYLLADFAVTHNSMGQPAQLLS